MDHVERIYAVRACVPCSARRHVLKRAPGGFNLGKAFAVLDKTVFRRVRSSNTRVDAVSLPGTPA